MPLVIDKEALSTAQTAYNKNAEAMNTLKGELDSAITDLRGAWDSEAGTEFFKKFDDTLSKNMGLYANVIAHMAENMKTATDKYEEVFEEAEQLKLEL